MENAIAVKETNQKRRDSNIELLRILSMVMIILHHFSFHGGFLWDSSAITVPHLWCDLISMGGKIGVDVFVLISGYYLIKDDRAVFNIKRILKFWGQVFFYSAICFAAFAVVNRGNYSAIDLIKNILKTFFPITFSQWWFASTYFVLYLFHPFLNKALLGIGQSLYKKLIVLLVICWSIIPTFTPSLYQSNTLLWFVVLYAIAGYIRLYGFGEKLTAKAFLLIFAISAALTYLSDVVFTLLGTKWSVFSTHSAFFYGQEKINILVASVSLFMAFAKLKIRYIKPVNVLASATFGVYLLHDNYVIRPLLWNTVFKNAQFQNSLLIIPYSIFAALSVYAIGTLVDLLRIKIFEKAFLNITSKLLQMIDPVLKKLKNLVLSVFDG